MCPITFWMHECFFCGAVKDNASRYDPAITTTCPGGCNTPVQEKLEWRYWICPPCEEERATDERKYPPRGQPPQQRGRAYMFPNETQPQNGTQRQGEPRSQAAPRFQDAPRYQPLQNIPGGRHLAQQYPAQQEEQRPQYFQMGQPPRGQDEPRRHGCRESRHESHGHHHHDHYY